MLEIVGAVLAALLGSSILKKSKHVLWILRVQPVRWDATNPKGNSLRNCLKAAREYNAHGVPFASQIILPLGVTPPPVLT